MSELKPCPLPLCGGEAEHTEGPDGESAVCCTTRGCLLTAWALSEDIWQALPRSIDVAAVVEKLRRFAGDADWEFGDGEPADLRAWCDELEGRHERAPYFSAKKIDHDHLCWLINDPDRLKGAP